MYQQELARNGDALFQIRDNYLQDKAIIGAMIVFSSSTIDSYTTSDGIF